MSPVTESEYPVTPDPLASMFEQRLARVQTEISPNDSMLEGNPGHYFSVGRSAFRCIREAMLAAGRDDFASILDFGSGFGRVLRVLRATFPDAALAACDISPEALEFCSETFGAEPFRSSEDPGEIRIARRFDLVWCGTLLTNLDAPRFLGLLDLFASLLSPGGLLVFTTHGPFVAQRLRSGEFQYGVDAALIPAMLEDYGAAGYGYVDYPGEVLRRLRLRKYGISISTPAWVRRQIELRPGLRLLNYSDKAWDNHQDSVGCLDVARGSA